MSTAISNTIFTEKIKKQIYIQEYGNVKKIDDVQFLPLSNHVGDEGDFCEIIRTREDGGLEMLPNFRIRQINRTRLFAGSVKAWHVHQRQDEIWYISPHAQLFVGLWDLRKDSKTSGNTMRVNIGCGGSRLLYIPRGVAHGSANFGSDPVELFYIVNQQFDAKDPDECRLHWDAQGKEFWTPERD